MEVESKKLHKSALPMVFGIVALITIFSLATNFTDKTLEYASALDKNVIEIKSNTRKNGILTIHVKQDKNNESLNEVGRAADYYFKFN